MKCEWFQKCILYNYLISILLLVAECGDFSHIACSAHAGCTQLYGSYSLTSILDEIFIREVFLAKILLICHCLPKGDTSV